MTFTKREKFLLIRGIAIQIFIDRQNTEFSDISFEGTIYGLIQDLKIDLSHKEIETFTKEAFDEQEKMTKMAKTLLNKPTTNPKPLYNPKDWV